MIYSTGYIKKTTYSGETLASVSISRPSQIFKTRRNYQIKNHFISVALDFKNWEINILNLEVVCFELNSKLQRKPSKVPKGVVSQKF